MDGRERLTLIASEASSCNGVSDERLVDCNSPLLALQAKEQVASAVSSVRSEPVPVLLIT